jgi:undecaprenyl-diphosphatase
MMTLDITVFHLLHGLGAAGMPLRVLSVFFATYLAVAALVFGMLVLAAGWRDRARRLEIVAAYLRAAAAALFAYLCNALIAAVAFRPRPYVALGTESFIGVPLTAKSFPSDHATLAFAVAAVLAYAWPNRASWFLAAAALIALGRVMAGVHYPSDILAGAALGLLWAWLVETVDVRGGGAYSLRVARILTRQRV